jgi:hypothetical protein
MASLSLRPQAALSMRLGVLALVTALAWQPLMGQAARPSDVGSPEPARAAGSPGTRTAGAPAPRTADSPEPPRTADSPEPPLP